MVKNNIRILIVGIGVLIFVGTFTISQVGYIYAINKLISADTFILCNDIGLLGVLISFPIMIVGSLGAMKTLSNC